MSVPEPPVETPAPAASRSGWPAYAFGITLGLLVALYVLQTDSGPAPSSRVSATVQRYQVTSDLEVEVDLTVSREDPTRPALCELSAQDAQGQPVGRREVRAPAQPSGQEDTELTVTLTTTGRAQSLEVGRCAQSPPTSSPGP